MPNDVEARTAAGSVANTVQMDRSDHAWTVTEPIIRTGIIRGCAPKLASSLSAALPAEYTMGAPSVQPGRLT